jgi:hypothetical protein
MSDGLQFLTLGGSEEVIVGNEYCATLGMTNYTYVGSLTEVLAGVEYDMKLGGTFACEYGTKMEWTNVGGISIEDGEVFELNDEIKKQATTVEYSAGYGPVAAGGLVALSGLKKTIAGLIAGINAINLALGISTSATMIAQSEGENNGEQNLLDEETETSWSTISDSAYQAGAGMVANAAVYVTLKSLVKKLAHAYEALANVSTLKMDSAGIEQQTNFDAVSSQINMTVTGVNIKSGPAALGAFDPPAGFSSLSLPVDGSVVLNGNVSTTVKSPVIVRVGQLVGEDLSTGLSAEVAAVSLKNTNASQVRLLPEAAEMRALEVNVHSGANGFSTNAAETKMTCGPTAVTANDISVAISVDGGASGMRVYPSFVIVDSPLIQLG